MEKEITGNQKKPLPGAKKNKPEVYVLRDIKEYLGEAALIVFSVLLALFLTEYFNVLHEKSQTRELLENVKNELIKNKKAELEQYNYQLGIIKRIDSALDNPEFQKKILNNGEFHLKYLAPDGVLYRDLSTVAWDVARSSNITTKVHFEVISKLTEIYENQARIAKLEDEEARVLLDPQSRNFANIHLTLILVRDNYHGWAVDRAPSLLKKYDDAIKMLDSGKM